MVVQPQLAACIVKGEEANISHSREAITDAVAVGLLVEADRPLAAIASQRDGHGGWCMPNQMVCERSCVCVCV